MSTPLPTEAEWLELLPYLTPDEREELSRLLPTPLELIEEDPANVLALAGLTPDPWQAQLLRLSWPETLLLCSRQVGKTTTCAALVLAQVLTWPDSLVLILSPTQRQSTEMLQDKVLRLCDAVGCVKPYLTSRQQTSIRFSNGSRVVALPDNEAGIRGYSRVKLLVIDEASRVPDELYLAARPTLATSQGRLVALSTPYGQRGWFFQEWEQGQGWARARITATDCPRISPDFLARERLLMGPRWYQQEYELSFNQSIDQLFSEDVINRMFSPRAELL